MAAAPPMSQAEQAMITDLRAIRKQLEAAASQPAGSGISGSRMFGGFGGDLVPGDAGWPVEQLKHLEPYDMGAVRMMTGRRRNGRPALSGMGPALVKMAALAGNADARAAARSMGMGDNYGDDQFEQEYRFTSVTKAAKSGLSWAKGLNGEVRKTALAENSGVTGGYVVPPQFQNELQTIAAEDAFIEPRCKQLPMNTRTVQWPMLDITSVQAAGTSPYFGGILAQWQPEAATINETEPQFRQSEWTAWDLVLYCVSSNQLLADNGIGLDALLTQLFGQAITWYKEYAFLQGKGAGSSMPLGVLNAPATLLQNRATASHFKLQDAAAMMSHLQIRSWDDACWVMHQSVLPELIQLSDVSATVPGTAGQHLAWLPAMGDGKTGGAAMKLPQVFLNALPIFFTEKLPSLGTKGDVLLVDWSRYVVGQRLDLQIDVSPHYLFRNNQLAWRVIARCDAKPWLNSFVTDQAGWQVSPMVALN